VILPLWSYSRQAFCLGSKEESYRKPVFNFYLLVGRDEILCLNESVKDLSSTAENKSSIANP